MKAQYLYNGNKGQQLYNQEKILIQYKAGTNPLDPLGLQGANYTILDSNDRRSKSNTHAKRKEIVYQTKTEPVSYLNQNKIYTQQIKNNINQLYQNQIGQNIYYQSPPYIQNIQIGKNQNQQILQPNIKQNINQQVYNQKYLSPQSKYNTNTLPIPLYKNPLIQAYNMQQIHPQLQPQIKGQYQQNHKNQIQMQPQLQQKINAQPQIQYQHQKQISPQINQIQPIINPQQQIPQQLPLQYQQIIQQQQQIQQNQRINPLQQNQQIIQQQTRNIAPNQIQYQHYIQNINNQNLNKNIKIEYNKNNDHFVNKPIYTEKKISNIPQQIIPLNNNPTSVKGNIPIQNNINNYIVSGNQKPIQAIAQNKIIEKYGNTKLSSIEEEEINIEQSGFDKKISKLNSDNIIAENLKESPIEEKKPEAVFPDNIKDDHSQKYIIEKSLTESGITDYEANLDHLPTIYSIMKGKSDPLPPSKNKKY